jgi:N-formylglutamate amidohydrolase
MIAMNNPVYALERGDGPLIVSMPHCGTELAAGLAERLTPAALTLADTDWHIPRLYDFLRGRGVTMLAARLSRYVIDLNRPPDGASLYPGQATTDLCPTTLFDGAPLYRDGRGLTVDEVADRRQAYWQPYHDALAGEIERVKARHGYALVYDAHSIRSEIPRLFEGRLPDLNLGTARGSSLTPDLRAALQATVADLIGEGFAVALDGRFVGGYITRHYGRPADNVQVLQVELAQCRYMDETGVPFAYLPERADPLRSALRRVIDTMTAWSPR